VVLFLRTNTSSLLVRHVASAPKTTPGRLLSPKPAHRTVVLLAPEDVASNGRPLERRRRRIGRSPLEPRRGARQSLEAGARRIKPPHPKPRSGDSHERCS